MEAGGQKGLIRRLELPAGPHYLGPLGKEEKDWKLSSSTMAKDLINFIFVMEFPERPLTGGGRELQVGEHVGMLGG